MTVHLPYETAPYPLGILMSQVSDADHDPLRIVRVVQPAHGKVTMRDGDLWYTEAPGVWGAALDKITWTVGDGRGRYATSTVTISVRHPNAPPVANDTEVEIGAGATYVDLTLDTTDPEADDHPFIRSLGTPAHGRATQLSDTRVRYALTDDLPVGATDSFTYTVGDLNYGEATATVHVTVAAPRRPGAPIVGTVSPGKASAVVRWAAPADPGNSAISGYVVRAYSHGTLVRSTTTAAGARRATVSGLTNGRAYTFRVAATNAFGTGALSSASRAVTARTTPGAPTLRSVTSASEALVVRWAAPTNDGGADVTGYLVRTYASGNMQTEKRVGAAARSVTMGGLAPTGPYYVRVQAVNEAGGGTWSAASKIVRPGY
jgi:hypothetical protein